MAGMARGVVWGACLVFVCTISGCDPLWPDIHWRSERYVLIEIDELVQMSLSFDQLNGTCIGLVDATVFAIGCDNRYIVVEQHPRVKDPPSRFRTKMDRTITNYWVVSRSVSPSWRGRERGVRGPMTKSEFDSLDAEIGLPKFQKVFRELQ
jgi:hypothetical protein